MYDNVVSILRSEFFWPLDCTPAPKPIAKALETETPQEIAARLNQWCWAQAARVVRYGVEPGSYNAYVHVRYQFFATRREYWTYNTALALGQFVEPPEDKTLPALTTTQWAENLAHGRDYLGYRNHDPASDEGARRRAKAANVPDEWVEAGLSRVWEFLALSDYPAKLDDYRGLDTQQVLDNLWAGQRGAPRPWLPISRAN